MSSSQKAYISRMVTVHSLHSLKRSDTSMISGMAISEPSSCTQRRCTSVWHIAYQDWIFHSQDYEDDGEHGCGAVILKQLTEWKIYHRAIFVIRLYGNKHLGPSRFTTINEVIKSAISRSSHNSITGQLQYPWDEVPPPHPSARGGKSSTQTPSKPNKKPPASPKSSYAAAATRNTPGRGRRGGGNQPRKMSDSENHYPIRTRSKDVDSEATAGL